MNADLDAPSIPNLEAVKAAQKATWESGDFGQLAHALEHFAVEFMARMPLVPGARVLDVACGTGNLAILAARRGCVVSGIDFARNLIAQARTRAAMEGLHIDYNEGDVEALPFPGCTFDLVVSMFGVMFAPRPDVAAAELLRVTKPGGRIAMANWASTGFFGKMQAIFKAYLPLPAGVPSPLAWGDETIVRLRLQNGLADLRLSHRTGRMRYPFSPAETVEFLSRCAPTHVRALASLDAGAQAALKRDLVELHAAHNVAQASDTTEIAVEYLEIVARRR